VNLLRFLIPLLLLGATHAEQAPRQKFICNVGYSPEECHRQFAILRPALARFHTEAVGDWSWILVRSCDWKELAQRMGGNPDSPAFSVLEARVTVFEEALVEPIPQRRAELMKIWHMRIDDLLDEAVTHELGHVLCRDTSEARAERRAQAMQHGEKVACMLPNEKGRPRERPLIGK
jgi:hypothetical protein